MKKYFALLIVLMIVSMVLMTGCTSGVVQKVLAAAPAQAQLVKQQTEQGNEAPPVASAGEQNSADGADQPAATQTPTADEKKLLDATAEPLKAGTTAEKEGEISVLGSTAPQLSIVNQSATYKVDKNALKAALKGIGYDNGKPIVFLLQDTTSNVGAGRNDFLANWTGGGGVIVFTTSLVAGSGFTNDQLLTFLFTWMKSQLNNSTIQGMDVATNFKEAVQAALDTKEVDVGLVKGILIK